MFSVIVPILHSGQYESKIQILRKSIEYYDGMKVTDVVR